MLSHYLKTLLRNLRRDRTFAGLNLLGLGIGLVAFILIVLYVRYESSFDQYHENKDQLYRVIKREHGNAYYGTDYFAVTQGPLAATLQADFPEVEKAGRVWFRRNVVLGIEDQTQLQPYVFGIDPSILSMFTFKLIDGSLTTFSDKSNQLILTATAARKLFGDEQVVGSSLLYQKEHLFEVAAVIEDMPDNSHFQMDVIVDFTRMASLENRNIERWNNSSFYTYIQLAESVDPVELNQKLPAFVERYITASGDNETSLYLEPLQDIYLRSKANFQIGPTNDVHRLRIYLFIAFIILTIACINYVNLSTAKAVKRAKEVGVRKTIGASRKDLLRQFLGESFFITVIALWFALMLLSVILPYFSEFAGSHLSLNFREQTWVLPFLLGTTIVVTLLAGAYPAFVLSGFRTIDVLKGKGVSVKGKGNLRNILVVVQFTMSAALIICAVVISRQLTYIKNKDLGYAKEQILIVELPDEGFQGEELATFKSELRRLAIADQVASGSSLPSNISSNSGAQWPGKPQEVDISLYTAYIDQGYLDLFDMQMVAGVDPASEEGKARGGVILNESAVAALGWEEPVGRQMVTWNGDTTAVLGVIKDFHQHSLHLAIAPAQLFLGDFYADHVAVKLNTDDFEDAIGQIKTVYESFSLDYPFEYRFFDEIFTADYAKDQKTLVMANWSTLLIILIACLGLYGLSLFRAESRRKEVGVRKVLGASLPSLFMLLSKEFVWLTLTAFLIAIPIALYVMQRWLANFAYHINLEAIHFLLPFGAILLVALLTVSYQTYQAVASNPIEALKEE